MAEDTKDKKPAKPAETGEQLRAAWLDSAPGIRKYFFEQLKQGPLMAEILHERLRKYNLRLYAALDFIEIGADQMNKPWQTDCATARTAIYDGIRQRPMGNTRRLELA